MKINNDEIIKNKKYFELRALLHANPLAKVEREMFYYAGVSCCLGRKRSLIGLAEAFCVAEGYFLSRDEVFSCFGIDNHGGVSHRMRHSNGLRVLKQLSRLRKIMMQNCPSNYLPVVYDKKLDGWRLLVNKNLHL